MKSLRNLSPAGFLVLALLGACLSTGMASAQDPKGPSDNWNILKSLAPGQEIRVVMNDVKSYQGEFVSLSDSGITLRQPAGEQTLAPQDIVRVSAKTGQNHPDRKMLAGTAVGAAAGLITGVVINNHIWNNVNCTEGPAFNCAGPPNPHWGYILTPAGGLGGAIIGRRVRAGGWHDVYRAHSRWRTKLGCFLPSFVVRDPSRLFLTKARLVESFRELKAPLLIYSIPFERDHDSSFNLPASCGEARRPIRPSIPYLPEPSRYSGYRTCDGYFRHPAFASLRMTCVEGLFPQTTSLAIRRSPLLTRRQANGCGCPPPRFSCLTRQSDADPSPWPPYRRSPRCRRRRCRWRSQWHH